jgi:hypothetical protein
VLLHSVLLHIHQLLLLLCFQQAATLHSLTSSVTSSTRCVNRHTYTESDCSTPTTCSIRANKLYNHNMHLNRLDIVA